MRGDRAALLRAALAAGAVAAPGLAAADALAAPRPVIRPHPRWRFVFVNHATTNPFFVPARYGIEDAAELYGVAATWTGSRRSDVREMAAAMRRAIDSHADGIAISVIDATAFDSLTARALDRGIPVIAYNADGGRANRRLAYVGQDLYQSGLEFGARIAGLVGEGDVALFIATPGALNLQPRVDGALDAIRDSGKPIRPTVVRTGADYRGAKARIEAYYDDHRSVRGLFATGADSTQAVAQFVRQRRLRRRGVHGGGYDLLPGTLEAIRNGQLDFTIDQQPYLQGYLPIQQLFFARYSGGLVTPADTNTGLAFVTRENVRPYISTSTRYEGSSSRREYPAD
jgi:simple sugar transport system substrate-binding protein